MMEEAEDRSRMNKTIEDNKKDVQGQDDKEKDKILEEVVDKSQLNKNNVNKKIKKINKMFKNKKIIKN